MRRNDRAATYTAEASCRHNGSALPTVEGSGVRLAVSDGIMPVDLTTLQTQFLIRDGGSSLQNFVEGPVCEHDFRDEASQPHDAMIGLWLSPFKA